jgi:nicotinate-nucleotide adenylyltransferase
MTRRIGLLGGTFDPPHLGHLVLAEAAIQSLGLDQVWFVPAGRPPHKPTHRLSSARQRLAMVRRAVRGFQEFRVVAMEIDRRGPSYTVETLEVLQARSRRSDWWLLLGSDMLRDLPNWRRPARVVELAGIGVMARPGHSPSWPRRLRRGRLERIDAPMLEISSTELRARVSRNASIQFLVPEGVRAYIGSQGLYRSRHR